MKNKSIIIGIIVIFLIVISINAIIKMDLVREEIRTQKQISENEIAYKSNKDTIYELFNNFPECDNIYYLYKNLYNERYTIGPTIYQLDILAELTDEGYNSFIEKVEFQTLENLEIKVNPNNVKYNWNEVKNIEVLKSKDIEETSVKKVYLDEERKTIYIIAIGGNWANNLHKDSIVKTDIIYKI